MELRSYVSIVLRLRHTPTSEDNIVRAPKKEYQNQLGIDPKSIDL